MVKVIFSYANRIIHALMEIPNQLPLAKKKNIFFGHPTCMQDLNPSTRDWAGPRHGKHQVLTTRPPGNSQSKSLVWLFLLQVTSSAYPDNVCSVNQSCLTLCNPVDHSPPGSSVHGILQARILERVIDEGCGSNMLNPLQHSLLFRSLSSFSTSY